MRIVLLLLFLVIVSTPNADETLNIKNFSENIVLHAVPSKENDFIYNNIKLKTNHHLLLKVSNSVKKTEIPNFNPSILDVTELFRLKDSVYYSVAIDKKKSLALVMQSLQQHKNILFVQPDLLQVKTRQHEDHKPLPPIDHISLLGIKKLWDKGKGDKIKIAIIDDGFDLNHEDLKNTKVIFQYDMQNKLLDASPKLKEDRHGTQVAGIIFASHNNIGANGIAPNAEFIAIRDTDTRTSNLLLAFNLAKLAGANVINCSWTSQLLLEPVADVINDLAKNGRSGKGIALVFSAGNGKKELTANSSEATLDSVISIGSHNEQREKTAFTNYGKYVQFYTYGRRILTTGPNPKHPYKNFGGTSASAPIVTGLIALLLSHNKELTLEQIKQQLPILLGKVN